MSMVFKKERSRPKDMVADGVNEKEDALKELREKRIGECSHKAKYDGGLFHGRYND